MSASPPTPIVSYAQHCEDVRLARCFGKMTDGFYIDVGAWHPMLDSVTWHFYKSGWHGINVEPAPEAFELLERYRPRDVNIACLVGDECGEETIHLIGGTGLSTTSTEYAARAQSSGLSTSPRKTVRRTLADICAEHTPDAIHFLKVDVEGDEPAVLRGHDWKRWRPWVVVVEGTEPGSPVRTEATCRLILERVGYQQATFDGLNDFYVADERADLAANLVGPISPFERAGSMRERALHDVHGNGPLGRWYQAYQRSATAELLSRGITFDVAAYLRALGVSSDAAVGEREILRAYPLVLGRDADADSVAIWSTLVRAEGIAAGAFLNRLCASEEYLALRLTTEAYLVR